MNRSDHENQFSTRNSGIREKCSVLQDATIRLCRKGVEPMTTSSVPIGTIGTLPHQLAQSVFEIRNVCLDLSGHIQGYIKLSRANLSGYGFR